MNGGDFEHGRRSFTSLHGRRGVILSPLLPPFPQEIAEHRIAGEGSQWQRTPRETQKNLIAVNMWSSFDILMRWEELTWKEFPEAVKKSQGVCILTIGVLEQHGNHLPLGTDFLNIHKFACLAADKEPAVVFPQFYFGQVYEAQHMQGTVAIKPQLTVDLLENVCDEIGRNGFKKILIINGHGGNGGLIDFFLRLMHYRKKNYVVYLAGWWHTRPEGQEYLNQLMDTKEHGHACECETSWSLANFPELVKMDSVPEKPGHSLDRLKHLEDIGVCTPFDWYGHFPGHYAGDARPATRKKGEKIREKWIEHLTRTISVVKKDNTLPLLYAEFFARIEH